MDQKLPIIDSSSDRNDGCSAVEDATIFDEPSKVGKIVGTAPLLVTLF